MKTDDKLKTFSQLLNQPSDYRDDSEQALNLAIEKMGGEASSIETPSPIYAKAIDVLSGIHSEYLEGMFNKDTFQYTISKKEIEHTVDAANKAVEALEKIPDKMLKVFRGLNIGCRSNDIIPYPRDIIEQLEAIIIQINRKEPTASQGANENKRRKQLIEEVYHFVGKFFWVKIPKHGKLAEGKAGKEFVNPALESVFLIANTFEEDIERKNISGTLKLMTLKKIRKPLGLQKE